MIFANKLQMVLSLETNSKDTRIPSIKMTTEFTSQVEMEANREIVFSRTQRKTQTKFATQLDHTQRSITRYLHKKSSGHTSLVPKIPLHRRKRK